MAVTRAKAETEDLLEIRREQREEREQGSQGGAVEMVTSTTNIRHLQLFKNL